MFILRASREVLGKSQKIHFRHLNNLKSALTVNAHAGEDQKIVIYRHYGHSFSFHILSNWARGQLRQDVHLNIWLFVKRATESTHYCSCGIGRTLFKTCCHFTRNWLVWTRLFALIVLKLNYSPSDSSSCLQCVIKHWEDCQYRSTSKSLNILILHIPCGWGHFLSVFSPAVAWLCQLPGGLEPLLWRLQSGDILCEGAGELD